MGSIILSCLIHIRYKLNRLLNNYILCGLCCRSCNNKRYRSNPSKHKLLLIGDSIISGYGDSNLTLYSNDGGLRYYLGSLIDSKQQIRQKWVIMDYFKLNSLSKQWLPGDTNNTDEIVTNNSYFSEIINNPCYSDCSLIILGLGNDDQFATNNYGNSIENYKETAINIVNVAKHLAIYYGKHVHIITPLQQPAAVTSNNNIVEPFIRRNQLIIEMCEDFNAKLHEATQDHKSDSSLCNNDSKDDDCFTVQPEKNAIGYTSSGGSVQVAVDCISYAAYTNKSNYCSNLINLNTKGYRQLASDCVKSILNDMIKIEFNNFCNQLLPQQNM